MGSPHHRYGDTMNEHEPGTEPQNQAEGEWVEAPASLTTDEEKIQYFVEKGAISEKPIRKRAKKADPNFQPSLLPLPEIYTREAFQAKTFIDSLDGKRYVFSCGQWWLYTKESGWNVQTAQEVTYEIAVFLRKMKVTCTEKAAQNVLFAMVPFCNIRTKASTFEPTFQLEAKEGETEAVHKPGWVACEDKIFHVPTVARAIYRGEKIPEEAVKDLSSDLFTMGKIPCKFNPNAVCPNWTTFVEQACPEDWPCLQEMFGLSLTYDRSFNAFFVIYGPSGTGKSTCLNVLQRLNDGTISQVSLGRFGERFFIWPLAQNRVNIVHDMDSIYEGDGSVSLREAVLKSVASGESIEVERKHRQAQREYLRALCVFGTNNLPRFADKSNAIGQRMRIIQFPNVFRDTESQVRNLHESFYKEMDGILIWALRGYGELLESGRNSVWESGPSQAAKTDSLKDSRPEILFCDDMLTKDELPTWKPSLDIYKAYQQYCIDRGYKPSGMNRAISLIVEYMGAKKERVYQLGKQYMGVKGIRLNTEPEI